MFSNKESVFKKVIGQDQGEAIRAAAQESYASESSAPADSAYTSSRSGRPMATTRNVLSSDVEIKGSVKFTDDLIVDGRIEGDIQSPGNLTIGENARIKAEIRTGSIIVYGKIHGNLTASERIELKSTAEVVGDIRTKTLSMEAGAIFVGKSTVGTPAQAAPAPAAQPAATKPAAAAAEPQPQQATLAGTEPQE